MAKFKYTPQEQRAIYAQMQRKKAQRDLALIQLAVLEGDDTTQGDLSGSILPRFCDDWTLTGNVRCVEGIAFTKKSGGGTGTAVVKSTYNVGVMKIIAGRQYKVSYELENASGGATRINVGGVFTANQTTDGIHEEIITASSDVAPSIQFQSGTDCTIKNIQVIKLPE
jgi:hypothetical protein